MGLGKRLAEIINSRHLKISQVAADANVSASTLYSIIDRDNKKIDIDVLLSICKALDVSTDYILYDDVQEKSDSLTPEHQNLLNLYDKLHDDDKIRIITKMETIIEDYPENQESVS